MLNRNKRPGYQAYDEIDDETGMVKILFIHSKISNFEHIRMSVRKIVFDTQS